MRSRPLETLVVAPTLVVALLQAGCTHAINVPPAAFEEAAQNHTEVHRIRTKDGFEYTVRQFAVTDTTIVIVELHHTPMATDKKRTVAPITLRRDDVESIERLDGRSEIVVLGVIGGAALAFLALVALAL